MQVRAPEGWTAISQGAGDSLPSDSERTPCSAGARRDRKRGSFCSPDAFIAYARRAADIDARVYLRSPDAALAERYLEATAHYVQLYTQLLGPYPYGKFALVENFWETGYGMPSLALLGPRVIRFPFILHSSFPHEILHNWWGNSVYLDPAGGNWSEGLTAYLADHLVQEQRGRGADHRRTALAKIRELCRRRRRLSAQRIPRQARRSFRGGGLQQGADVFPHAQATPRRRQFSRRLAAVCRAAPLPAGGLRRVCAGPSSR